MASIPPPPRMTGDPAFDSASVIEYLHSLYRAFVLEGLLAGDAPTVEGGNLPDPASTSLATAQQTANQAFAKATAAQTAADEAQEAADAAQASAALAVPEAGTVTIADAATTGELVFSEAQPDTGYRVSHTCTGTSGAPVLEATLIVGVTKATDKVTITVNTAPTAGKSVTFDVSIHRKSS